MSTTFEITTGRTDLTIELPEGALDLVLATARASVVLEVFGGAPGPAGGPGAQGSAGPGGAQDLIASSAIGGHRAVYIDQAGQAALADYTTLPPGVQLALTTTAAVAGDPQSVRLFGLVEESSWAWTEGPVFLGALGTLTQTAPVGGTIVQVGSSAGLTALFVNPRILAVTEGN